MVHSIALGSIRWTKTGQPELPAEMTDSLSHLENCSVNHNVTNCEIWPDNYVLQSVAMGILVRHGALSVSRRSVGNIATPSKSRAIECTQTFLVDFVEGWRRPDQYACLSDYLSKYRSCLQTRCSFSIGPLYPDRIADSVLKVLSGGVTDYLSEPWF